MGRILFGTRAALGAALAFVVSAPALAAENASVQVQWTVRAVGSIAVASRSTASTSAVGSVPDAISRCGAATSAADGSSAVVTFASIVPDAARSAACFAPGAAAVAVVTNAPHWQLSQVLESASTPGVALCAFPAGTVTSAAMLSSGGVSACPAQTAVGSLPSLVASGDASYGAAPPVVEDLGLVLAPNAPSGAASFRLDFTLTYD